jgi:hypothetical protein
MINHVDLITVDFKYFKLELSRDTRDEDGTYKLVRYKLPQDERIQAAVAKQQVVWYMSEYSHMSDQKYQASKYDLVNPGVDLEDVAIEKVVTDVSNILRFHDTIIDNRTIDPDYVYAYVIQVDESSTKYTAPWVVGYIESKIEPYSTQIKPTVSYDILKHRGISDINIVNALFESIRDDIKYSEGIRDTIESDNDDIIDNIKVEDLLDTFEKVLAMFNMIIAVSPPSKFQTQDLDWGVAEWGSARWGFARIILELGFPYQFTGD